MYIKIKHIYRCHSNRYKKKKRKDVRSLIYAEIEKAAWNSFWSSKIVHIRADSTHRPCYTYSFPVGGGRQLEADITDRLDSIRKTEAKMAEYLASIFGTEKDK